MEFKAGDRVHVTRLNGDKVDFYATLKEKNPITTSFILTECTNKDYDKLPVWKAGMYEFGDRDYYTLATDEAKGLKWSDGSSAEGKPIMCDEEDTEEPVIQRIRYMNKAILES